VHHLNGVRKDNRVENLCLVNYHNHHHDTYVKQLQKRIRELETNQSAELIYQALGEAGY
jgi:hypothetical protein